MAEQLLNISEKTVGICKSSKGRHSEAQLVWLL